MDNNLASISMKIILHAGNARQNLQMAHNHLLQKNIEGFHDELKKAKENITLAHNSQTETIQTQIAENKSNIDLLFIHAQDTLMTIMSEYNTLNMIGKTHIELLSELEELKNN